MKKLLLSIGIGIAAHSLQAQYIQTFPYIEDFENQSTCGTGCGNTCFLGGSEFTNDVGDQIDWAADAFGTGSGNTGPTANSGADHNPGVAGGIYLYTETSGSCSGGDIGNLVSPYYDFTGLEIPYVSFWYHMFGGSMGTMHFDVDTTQGNGPWITDYVPAWTDNLDQWQNQIVFMAPFIGMDSVRFRIRAVTGSSFTSDMAVDDFRVSDTTFSVGVVGGNLTPCFNDTNGSIIVSADPTLGVPPFSYLWNTGATVDTLENLGPGTYCVTVTDANNDTASTCYVMTASDSILTSLNTVQDLICKYDVGQYMVEASGGDSITIPYVMDTTSSKYSWDSSGTCNTVIIPAGQVSASFPIGFDFEFYGNQYNEFEIASNGFIGFGGGLDNGCCSGEPVPHNSAFEPNNAIFAAWFDVDGSEEYSYCLAGEAPLRRLIVNFIALGDNTFDDNYTGQIILHETTNCIEIQTDYMQYQGFYNAFDDVTQGITNIGSTLGQAFPGRNSDENGASGGWEANDSYVSFCPIDSTGLSYTWSDGTIGSTLYQNMPGNYMVTVEDALGCNTTETLVISPAPSTLTLNPSITDVSCFGANDGMIETNTSGASGTATYMWSDGSANADLSGVSGGTYSVVVMDALNCLDSAENMFIFEPPILQTTVFNVMATNCPDSANGSAQAVASGGYPPYIYTWMPAAVSGTTVSNLTAGNQQLMVTDSAGCTAFKSVAILSTGEKPEVDLGPDQFSPNGDPIILDAGLHTSYDWSPGNNSISTYSVTETGLYFVTVTNEDGCQAKDSVFVEVWALGVDGVESNILTVYPNPTADVLNIELGSEVSLSEVELTVFDINGKIVASINGVDMQQNQMMTLDVKHLTSGTYSLSIKADGLLSNHTFVKQ